MALLGTDQIAQIEKLAINLRTSADNFSYESPCVTKVELTLSWRYKQTILLVLEKTNIGAKIEKDFAQLDRLHQEYESWRGKTITEHNEQEFLILVDRLKGTLYDLADTLRQIVRNATKETKRRTVKLILYITSAAVGFLGALLTCIYLLWWLLTKFPG